MSNLGKYQDITTWAKDVGGVDKLIEAIGSEAVLKAAPKLVGVGIVAGGALFLGGRTAVTQGKVLRTKFEAVRGAAAQAKTDLRARLEKSDEPDGLQSDDQG
ncbi:hypothetical protein EDF46_0041 [Frondihabitans sp. PhB188]|uniref:hypothetical protein n=1 Tax=Frondihabitans sp. PhB188 TaxID=2485200 RepID=UPI000F4A59D8|nr:hypothetical protein [Frondihabitans sp. PhB188]ROQ40682.1 hypothetical protein EDF46_0041 [Frondihabitans sp. PhB188]